MFTAELENMASNVTDKHFGHEHNISEETISRWRRLFSCSSMLEAKKLLEHHRNNLTRACVSDEHWEIVRTEKEAGGYDRESYEFSLECEKNQATNLIKQKLATTMNMGSKLRKSYFILKLEGPLSSAIRIQEAARLGTLPTIVIGETSCGKQALSASILSQKKLFNSGYGKNNSAFNPLSSEYQKPTKTCLMTPYIQR